MFVTHLELIDAEPADYQKLNAFMEDAGFARTFRTDSGVVYQLPTFEYFGGGRDIAAVLQAAKAAAAKTGRSCAVMTSETSSIRFDGLTAKA